jgi:hypothetical protein
MYVCQTGSLPNRLQLAFLTPLALSQVLLEHLEPSYVVLRSPLLPAITNELPAPDVIFGARQDESHADRASRHYGQLRASRLRGSSGKDGDVIHAGAQVIGGMIV